MDPIQVINGSSSVKLLTVFAQLLIAFSIVWFTIAPYPIGNKLTPALFNEAEIAFGSPKPKAMRNEVIFKLIKIVV